MMKLRGGITRSAFMAGAALLIASPALAAGDEIRPITIWARTQAANPQAYQAAQLIAQAWKDLGLEVEVKGIPRPQQSDLVWYKRDEWDTTMWQMVGRPERSDPDEVIYNLFHSSTAQDGYNFVGYINPEYDKVVEAQRAETDESKRQELVKKSQAIIAEDQPYMLLVYPTKVFAFDKTVWDPASMVEQAGLGIKNFWTFISAQPLGDQKDMIVNSSDEMNAINPLYISGATDSWVTELIWDRLMRIGPDGLPQPWAAESYEWLDPTTIELKIRPDMKWHDGQPVTVEDVVFSFEAPATGDESPMYKPFVEDITSVEAVDEHTVRMTLAKPNAAFLTSTLAKINLIPKHVWAPILADLVNKPENAEQIVEESRIGSGPFKYADWTLQQQVVLEANKDHWAAPKMDRWILRIIPNVEAALGMLRSGEVNFMSDYTGDPQILIDIAQQDGDLEIVDSVDIGFQFLGFNLRRPPFDNVHFRRALSFAVPRELMVAAAWNGFSVPSNSVVSPALPFWYNESVLPIETGPKVAKAELAEGGFELIDGRLHYPDGVTEQNAK
ncbi:MAG TPA: ABC transporter substrate-binding protein [Geminicoccaceae bacterium]|nr:ABC transporter substrate-binding protein [Geminicoccaceae bacterium]